jgi:hypothetical protein
MNANKIHSESKMAGLVSLIYCKSTIGWSMYANKSHAESKMAG